MNVIDYQAAAAARQTKSADRRILIRVEGLSKSFGKLKVLKNINESIREGEVVTIIGPSGGGKSTFLRCLNLLERPDGGRLSSMGPTSRTKR